VGDLERFRRGYRRGTLLRCRSLEYPETGS
jgi:hypothetical protein